MESQKMTIVLLVLIVIAAMWSSGRLALLINTVMGKASQDGNTKK